MKSQLFFFLPALLFFLFSCEKEETVSVHEENLIASIIMPVASSVQEQEMEITIQKGTPCHKVSKVVRSVNGYTMDYNIILEATENACITVVANETVKVIFDPSGAGEYTLNFLINGELLETRTLTVAN